MSDLDFYETMTLDDANQTGGEPRPGSDGYPESDAEELDVEALAAMFAAHLHDDGPSVELIEARDTLLEQICAEEDVEDRVQWLLALMSEAGDDLLRANHIADRRVRAVTKTIQEALKRAEAWRTDAIANPAWLVEFCGDALEIIAIDHRKRTGKAKPWKFPEGTLSTTHHKAKIAVVKDDEEFGHWYRTEVNPKDDAITVAQEPKVYVSAIRKDDRFAMKMCDLVDTETGETFKGMMVVFEGKEVPGLCIEGERITAKIKPAAHI